MRGVLERVISGVGAVRAHDWIVEGLEHLPVHHVTYAQSSHATLEEAVLARVGAQVLCAMVVVVQVDLHCTLGEDLD